MRIKEIKVYDFEELDEKVREKVLQNLYDINVSFDWWEYIYEDARIVGIKIEAFDLGRKNYAEAKFIWSAKETADAIIENHGEKCETYKTAQSYLVDYEELKKATVKDEDDDLDTEEIDRGFLNALCEDYRVMLYKEYENQTSEEAIIETIKANEYEFMENGKIAPR
jgi:hypothetical protein